MGASIGKCFFFQINPFYFKQYFHQVINMSPGKWPTALQPRFFDVCEQLAQQVANTVEPFLQELVAANQLWVTKNIFK